MPDTIVIQSHAPDPPAWLQACLGSVADWAAGAGFAHRVAGDDLLDRVPADLRAKSHGRTQVVADLARLDWIAELLAAGWARVIWLDADVLLFAPDRLTAALALPASGYLFGREVWVQPDTKGRPRARRNLHNAVLAFAPGNPVLDFYRHAAARVLGRHDGPPVPQLIGPKLLTSLDNTIGLDATWAVGMASPLVSATSPRAADRPFRACKPPRRSRRPRSTCAPRSQAGRPTGSRSATGRSPARCVRSAG